MAERIPVATHYALLIGINYYPDDDKALKGCVRDVREIQKHLIRSRPDVDVKVLTASSAEPQSHRLVETPEQLATHDNVVASLDSITSRASPGDFVYIHFSGHGTIIAPRAQYSSRSTGDLSLALLHVGNHTGVRYLRGTTELAPRLKAMVEKKLLVTVVLDCCFSGSVVRGDGSRFLVYDPSIDAAHAPIKPPDRGASMLLNWMANPDGYCILAACGPAEKAKEAEFDGEHYGMLSYYLLEAFRRRGGVGGRLEHIYALVRARFLKDQERKQNPMLYGNRRLCFFEGGSGDFDAVPIPLVKSSRTSSRLDAGRAHGVCEGDEFLLWSCDSHDHALQVEQDTVAAKVSRAGDLQSDLEVMNPEPGSKMPSLTATARTHLLLRQYSIGLELHIACHDVWRSALAERPSLNVHLPGDATPGAAHSFSVVIRDQEVYEIRDEANQVIDGLPAAPYSLLENAHFVLDIVQHLARFKLVQDLSNVSPFGESIEVQLFNQTTGKSYGPGCLATGPFLPRCPHPGCVAEAHHGDVLELSLWNMDDRPRHLYVHAYVMGSNWEVENLLRGDHDVLLPRRSNISKFYAQGTPGDWRKKVQMTVPQYLRDRGKSYCDDTIKILVTLQKTSFMSLELPEIGELLKRYKIKPSRDVSHGSPEESWAVLSFRIRTRV